MPAGSTEARGRVEVAEAFLEAAREQLGEVDRPQFANVAATNAVLSGIAASDSIGATRLRVIHRGDDHRGAVELLETATRDGQKLARTLGRLLDLEGRAEYGVDPSSNRATDAVRWAGALVERAREELER